MHSAPFLNFLHTLRRRAMRKGRSIQSKYMNTGNSAIIFSPDTCLVGYAKRQIRTSSCLRAYRKLRTFILSGYLPGGICEATSEDDVIWQLTCTWRCMHIGCHTRAHWRARLVHSAVPRTGASLRRCKHTNKVTTSPAAIVNTYMSRYMCIFTCSWWDTHVSPL